MISRQTIDRVFEAARVEEVIGEFVQLKKAGSNFKGLSPFTDEKSPSFMVSPVKQIWKDFSTGKGGNAISFLMEHEHYSYPEAIKFLAKKYNVEIEETQQSDAEKQQTNERESMFLVSTFAKDYFHDLMLNSQQGKAIGLSYFKERGFTDESIAKFELGYCKDEWDNFTTAALAKGYDLKYLASTGLSIVKEATTPGGKGKQFDRFKGRVLFPIHSMSGRILGFGGRILTNDKKAAKYLNSPESDIYHKSKILYGIYQAKKEIAKQDTCFLVEGYTDVVSFHQAGVENVVASSGTALTSDQIRLVRRLTQNITVLFDGDAAGLRAAIRGIDLILEQGMNVKVISFPEGEDPDSFAKSRSSEALKSYLETEAQDFISFKVSLLLKEAKNDPIKKATVIRDIITSISKIPDGIQREVYVQECARLLEVSEQILFSELAQLLKKGQAAAGKQQTSAPGLAVVKKPVAVLPKVNALFLLEKEIIRLLLLYGNQEVSLHTWEDETDSNGTVTSKKVEYTNTVSNELYLHLQEDEIAFSNADFKAIYFEIIHQLNQDEKISIDTLITHPNSQIAHLVTSILMDEEKYALSDWGRKEIYVTDISKILPKAINDAVYNFRRILIEKKINEILSDVQAEKESLDLELIANYTDLKKRLFEKLNRVV